MTVGLTRPHLETILAGARSIYVSACAAEIAAVPALLQRHRAYDISVTGIFSPLLNRRSYSDAAASLRMRTFFLTPDVKRHLEQGLVDYCPWRYSVIDRWLSAPGRFDTALVMVSPPDAAGCCSLGVQADFLPGFLGKVARIVGFINPHMPRTAGDTFIELSRLSATVDYDAPLMTMRAKVPDPVTLSIAARIVSLVQDRATVQFGIGQIPSQTIAHLTGHRGLRVHSGVVDDNILTLEASGALDRDSPVVTGTAVGTEALYEAVGDTRRFVFRKVAHTHSHCTVSAIPCFTAINSVLQVDLLGQASAEGQGAKFVASPGGLPDFVRGAIASAGGRSIIAVRARSAGGPGIVALLDRPHTATVAGSDADIVVTEYGVAHIRDLSFDARAEALIAIAAPEDQDNLACRWAMLRTELLAMR